MDRVVGVERKGGRTSTERSLLVSSSDAPIPTRPSLFEEDVDVSNILNRDKSKLARTATMALVPLLRKCAITDRHFSARVMAARAVSNLTPLVFRLWTC